MRKLALLTVLAALLPAAAANGHVYKYRCSTAGTEALNLRASVITWTAAAADGATLCHLARGAARGFLRQRPIRLWRCTQRQLGDTGKMRVNCYRRRQGLVHARFDYRIRFDEGGVPPG